MAEEEEEDPPTTNGDKMSAATATTAAAATAAATTTNHSLVIEPHNKDSSSTTTTPPSSSFSATENNGTTPPPPTTTNTICTTTNPTTTPAHASSSSSMLNNRIIEQQQQQQQQQHTSVPQSPDTYSLWQRQAARVAKQPCTYLWMALLVSVAVSVLGMVLGNFDVSADNAGWQTRGTLIADRHSQFLLVYLNRKDLFLDRTGAVWDDMITNVQPGWETDESDLLFGEEDTSFWTETTNTTNTTTTTPTGNRRSLLVNDQQAVSQTSTTKMTLNTNNAVLMERWNGGDDELGRRRFLQFQKSWEFSTRTPDWNHHHHLAVPTTGAAAPVAAVAPEDNVKKTRASTRIRGSNNHHRLPFLLTPDMQRQLQEATSSSSSSNQWQGCDVSWYETEMLQDSRLWPIWHPQDVSEPNVLLRSDVLRDLCLSEQVTQQHLEQHGLCVACSLSNDNNGDSDDRTSSSSSSSSNRCLPPYSVVLFARLMVENGLAMSCDELSAAWAAYNEANPEFEQNLTTCSAKMATMALDEALQNMTDPSCPEFFSPILIDEWYSKTAVVQYTSSVFATHSNQSMIEDMYDMVDSFSRGTELIKGVYDTQNEDFVELVVDNAVGRDMALALGSAFITLTAILIHTRSPFLSLIGLLQIILSFPISFAVYTFIGQLEFFPFLNFIGVFVVFALGADDVFVAVDKWKNARIELHVDATTADIAAKALPDAAGAMFLTSLTTAVAFFGTAICPVAPIRMFAIFCGLLIVFDYIMCVVLVFPALCIYDQYRHKKNCCCRCHFCHRLEATNDDDDYEIGPDGQQSQERQGQEGEKKHTSLIHRILMAFYQVLHKTRYFLCVVCLAALILAIIYAAQMTLPTSADVRLLDSDSIQYEKNFEWRQHLLYSIMSKRGGSTAFVMWGVTPADTGDHNNPESFSQLVLDDSFEPSKQDAQIYLRDFCERFFANEWASPLPGEQESSCAINLFDEWLQAQAASDVPDDIYQEYCNGATGLPMAEADFDSCIYQWGQATREQSVLARNGKVEVMFFGFNSRVRYDSPYDDLDREWHTIENWINNEVGNTAPASANGMYFTSDDFWWYDTNGNMLNTAYVAAAIAIATAAVVILFSSRSVVLTIFSAFTIGYVLASVTACLVAIGWTLGFLESICFAILIGISCDFVIHFTHAYSTPVGHVNRHERTKFALLKMGPSILAAAFTTIAAATIMLFTIVTFFVKFAVILFLTVLQATVGSFVVFLVLADSFGPTDPTYVFDYVAQKLCGKANSENKEAAATIEQSDCSPMNDYPDSRTTESNHPQLETKLSEVSC